MTSAQKIALRISQVRQRLNEIAGLEGDTLTDEVRAEATSLQGEYSDLETRHQAAIVGEGDPRRQGDREAGRRPRRADREGEGKRDRPGDGREPSIGRRHEGAPGRARLGREPDSARALGAASTVGVECGAPHVGQEQRPIIPAVFPQSAAAFLGIMEERLPVGEAVYTVLSTSRRTARARSRRRF